MRPSLHTLAPRAAAAWLALLLLPAATVRAQGGEAAPPAGQEADPGAFIDVVNVDIVNVEVVVTERSGKAITGLTQDDFQILEDGRPVTITNFYSEQEEVGEVRRPTLPAPPGSPPPADAVPEEQRLYLIVFIDNFNIRPFNRNRVFARLREWLNSNVRVEDRVMLGSYNRSFKQRVPFTTDPRLISGALLEMETETGYGVHRDSERRQLIADIEQAQGIGEVMGQVRSYASSYHNDVMVTIDAIKDLVSSLGGLPGRKAFLYVSDGLPQVPAEDIYYYLNEKFQQSSLLLGAREFDATRRLTELANQANSNRVTFYTIDAGGLRTLTAASAEQQSAGASAFVDSQNTHNLQAPLRMLADETGGRAILNTNDVGPALRDLSRDLRTYYSLGYQPAHAGDGRFHRIEVKVKGRRGLQVRHRAGYRDKGTEQRMSDATMASLLFGELGNPLGVALEFGAMTAREDGNVLVPIHLRIPLDKLTMLPQQESHVARVRVFVAALDADGGVSPVQSAQLPITVPSTDLEVAKQKGWGYDVSLLMRPGQHRVSIGVRDELGGVSSYVAGTVFVRSGR
jgi:VWFA-related protein